MSVKDSLAARFGGHIRESMGASGPGAFELPTAAVIPGESPAKFQGCARVKAAILIETGRIAPDPNQPRKEFDEDALRRLAESLKARGQLQPIRVRWDATMERWLIIAGERRWRAAALAGLPTVAAVETTAPLTEAEVLEEQLIENTLREDLKPIELAHAYKSLLESLGLSQRQLAERLNVGQATIAKTLALLTLPESIRSAVDSGELGPSEAYQLTKVSDPAEQGRLARDAAAGRLKRDEIQERAKSTRKGRGGAKGKARKATERTFRVGGGKVTIENRRGLDVMTVRAMLAEAMGAVDAETGAAEAA